MTENEVQDYVRREVARQMREFLADFIHAPVPGHPSISDIINAVARRWCISVVDIMSDRRTANIATARQVAIWLCVQLTPHTMPVLGHAFQRDHTTILHAVKALPNKMRHDPDLCARVNALMDRLEDKVGEAA